MWHHSADAAAASAWGAPSGEEHHDVAPVVAPASVASSEVALHSGGLDTDLQASHSPSLHAHHMSSGSDLREKDCWFSQVP